MNHDGIHIGTAGWAVPSAYIDRFAPGASQLARYATRFTGVELNSSFYHAHRPATYARWAASTPAAFRMAVKMPRAITHERRLIGSAELLDRFIDEISALGVKLGPVLVQLPPSLPFDWAVSAAFWQALRARCAGAVVCEPRHASWFTEDADALLRAWNVARVAADPAPAIDAEEPSGWSGLWYLRLHGSPRRYYDAYDDTALQSLASRVVRLAERAPGWCIFDNTAAGAATVNALRLLHYLGDGNDVPDAPVAGTERVP